jgi:sigma-B regulation protein RsbU (phosphoserine phosphatase)
MVLHGVRGCMKYAKGARFEIGEQGMIGHASATRKMRYAPDDVHQDAYYIACELATRSEVTILLKAAGSVIGVLYQRSHGRQGVTRRKAVPRAGGIQKIIGRK